MSRTAVNVAEVARVNNGPAAYGGTDPAFTTIDSTLVSNGLSINAAGARMPLFLLVTNSAGSAKTVTVARGDGQGARGDAQLAVSVPASGARLIRVDDSIDYLQSVDGSMHVDFASGFTGTVAIFR